MDCQKAKAAPDLPLPFLLEPEGQGVISEFEVSGEGEALMYGSWDRDVDWDGDLGGVTGDGEI